MISQLRLNKGWSQEQLAEFAGLSLRTVQRVEKGQTVDIETLKSLAAVFEMPFQQLENAISPKIEPLPQADAPEHLAATIKHRWLRYAVAMCFLFLINLWTSPHHWWVQWVALGWGLALILRTLKFTRHS